MLLNLWYNLFAMLDYKKILNKEQILPVETLEGPVMVLAGAGSGKTRVLTYRIANLIEHGVSPYNILAITFTNKAAKEMATRVEDVTGIHGVFISTIHSFCVRVLREHIHKISGFNKYFSIFDDEASDKLIGKLAKEKIMQDDEEPEKEVVKALVKDCRFHISRAKSFGHTVQSYREKIKDNFNCDFICDIFAAYNNELKNNNALDFDDILSTTLELFTQSKDTLAECQERFQYIHVDEFQDTNKIQYTIIRLLASKYQNIFIVGDDDQSIYAWRGADYSNIKNFRKHFLGCQVFKLERNYRSTEKILNAANNLIGHNKDRTKKVLWTNNGSGAKVEYRELYNEKEEADYILGIINYLIRNDDYSYQDFAILVRTTSITLPIEDKLLLYNIPYRMIGGRKFYDRKEIKDFLAYLQVLVNPKDEYNLLRIINVPKRGIGEGAISKLKQACVAYNMSLFEGLINLPELGLPKATETKLMPIAALFRDFKSKMGMPIVDFVEHVYREIDFNQMYDESKEEDKERLENLKELISSIKQYNKDNPLGTLSEYLQSVTLMTSEDNPNSGENILTVATVHGVKGLEFRCVFIMGMEEGIFPIIKYGASEVEEEEERRIMYVAMTRAKERLFLTRAKDRFRFGAHQNTTMSSYIKESGLLKSEQEPVKFRQTSIEQTRPKIIDYTRLETKVTPQFAKKQEVKNVAEKDMSIFKVNQKVRHARFGEGVIINICGEQADITFPTLGTKKFSLRMAPIEILE